MYRHGSWLMITHGLQSNLQISLHSYLRIQLKVIYNPGKVTSMAEFMHAGDISKVVSATNDHRAVKSARLDGHNKCQKVLDASKATK